MIRHGFGYINLKWVQYELLELLYAKCYMLCWANVRSLLAFVKAQTAILRFNITADIGWRKELFCIPSSPAEDQHHTN